MAAPFKPLQPPDQMGRLIKVTQRQAALIEQLRPHAMCYRWLLTHWGQIDTDTVFSGIDEPAGARAIELVPTRSAVDPKQLHEAILRAMAATKGATDAADPVTRS